MSKNNLNWLFAKAANKNKDLTILEFGKLVFPEMKHESTNEINVIKDKVRKYLDPEKKNIPVGILQPIADILETDFNEMFGYKKKE